MTSQQPFRGIGVALLTLFDDNGQLLTDATAGLAEQIVGLGVGVVLVAGTTGEGLSMSRLERRELLQAVVTRVGDRATVVAGVSHASTDGSIELAQDAIAAGVHALLSTPTTSHTVIDHYRSVANVVGSTPVLAYHLPERFPPIPFDVLADLPVAGIKDSSNVPERLWLEVASLGYPIYTGSPHLLHTFGAMGGAGGLLGIANAYPELCVAAFEGDVKAQLELTLKENELWQLTEEGRTVAFPENIKHLTARRFDIPLFTRGAGAPLA